MILNLLNGIFLKIRKISFLIGCYRQTRKACKWLGILLVISLGLFWANPVPAAIGDAEIILDKYSVTPMESTNGALSVNTGDIPLGAYEFTLTYDPTVIVVEGIMPGSTPEYADAQYLYVNLAGKNNGTVKWSAMYPAGRQQNLPVGNINLAQLAMSAVGTAGSSTNLQLEISNLVDPEGVEIAPTTRQLAVPVSIRVAEASPYDVRAEDSSGMRGETVLIPININEIAGVTNFNLTIIYDPQVLTSVKDTQNNPVVQRGTLTSQLGGYTITPNEPIPGTIVVAAMKGEPYPTGAGSILVAKFTVNSAPAHLTSEIRLTFLVSPGNPLRWATTAPATFTVIMPPPQVAAVTPDHGPEQFPKTITVTGAEFQQGAVVYLGTIALTTVFKDSSTLEADIPGYQTVGFHDITVVNPDGQSATLSQAYAVIAPPEVTSVTPASGPSQFPTEITIEGSNFIPGPGLIVKIGYVPISVSAFSQSKIIATVPAGMDAGLHSVTVINPDGQSSLAGGFTVIPPPSVISINPSSGSPQTSRVVTITGTNFGPETQVTLGTTPPQDLAVTFILPISLEVTIPSGLPQGSYTLTVTNPDGQTTVSATKFSVITISISPTSGIIRKGGTIQLTASGGTTYTWSTGQASIATVDSTGKVTGTGGGKVTISATDTVSQASVHSEITVVELGLQSVSVGLNQTTQMTAIVTPADYLPDYTWSSNKPGIVSLTSVNQPVIDVTGKAIGLATITVADSKTGASASAVVKVVEVRIEPAEVTLAVGESTFLTAKGGVLFEWRGEPAGVVNIEPLLGNTSLAKITALTSGSVTVFAKEAESGVEAMSQVTIVDITIFPTTPSVGVNKKIVLTVQGGTPPYTWLSETPELASVDGIGTDRITAEVTGVAAGLASMKVTDANSKTKSVAVKIVEVQISPPDKAISIGDSLVLTASGGTGYTWASSNSAVAKVDVSLLSNNIATVTGLLAGQSIITATDRESKAVGSATIEVVKLNLDKTSLNLAVNGSATLTVSGGTGSYIWSSLDQNVAEVAPLTGGTVTVTGKGTGKTTVTVEDQNSGTKAVANVTVVSLKLVPSEKYLSGRLDQFKLVVESSPLGYSPVYAWFSSDSEAVHVATEGTVTAMVDFGQAEIRVSDTKSGATAKSMVYVKGITVSPTAKEIASGSSLTLTIPENEGIGPFAWLNRNPEVVSIDNSLTVGRTAVILAKAGGVAEVLAVDMGGRGRATSVITVIQVGLDIVSTTLAVDEEKQVKANGGKAPYTWLSDSPAVVEIIGDGTEANSKIIKGIAPGIARISATSAGESQAKATALIQVVALEITPSSPYLAKGASVTLSATGGNDKYNWSSSDPSVATVDAGGVVTGVKAGATTITARDKTNPNINGSTQVNVVEVTVSPVSDTIGIGKTKILSASGGSSYTWNSSNPEVATVAPRLTNSAEAIVTGKTKGQAVIKAIDTRSGAEASSTITVLEISVSPGENFIAVGQTVQLSATGGTSYAWMSSSPDKAEVSKDGLVTGRKAGLITITATDASGATGKSSVKVVEVSITPTSKSIPINGTVTFIASGGTTYSWTSSDPVIASVDGGVVKGLKAGTATIAATDTVSQARASAILNVVEVKVSPASAYVEAGRTLQLSATGAQGYTWAAANSQVATVDSSGLVKGLTPGVATISAIDPVTGASGSSTITVVKLEVAPASVSIPLSQSATLTVKGGTGYLWESSNPLLTSIIIPDPLDTSKASVTGLKEGTSVITVTDTASKISTKATVNVVSVKVSPAKTFLAVNGSINLTATGGITPYSWTSSAPEVAEVDSTGKVTALSPGSSVIRATGQSGASGSATIIVRAVTLDQGEAYLAIGKTVTFIASGGDSYQWESSDPSVASVNQTGTVTALAAGSTTIIVRDTASGAQNSALVTVVSLGISPQLPKIAINGQLNLVAQINPTGYEPQLNWSSDLPDVASVDEVTSLVTGQAGGTATITLTDQKSGASASTTVVVIEITVDPETVYIGIDQTADLFAFGSSSYQWVSSDPEKKIVSWECGGLPAASISFGNGAWTGLNSVFGASREVIGYTNNKWGGTAYMTVWLSYPTSQSPNSFRISGVKEVTIEPNYGDQASLSVQSYNLNLTADQTNFNAQVSQDGLPAAMAATLNGPYVYRLYISAFDQGYHATYKIGLPSKAATAIGRAVVDDKTLNSRGKVWYLDCSSLKVTGVSAGEVDLTATDITGASDQAHISVVQLSLTPQDSVIPLGEKLQLTAQGAASFEWFSSKPEIASIDSTGLVEAKSAGRTVINARDTASGFYAGGSVLVIDVTAAPSTATTTVGDSFQFRVGGGYTYEWTSLDQAVASVDQNGKATGLKVGTATIQVKDTISGAMDSAVLNVVEVGLKPPSAYIAVGGKITLIPFGGTVQNWKSNKPAIATVDNSGLVTGVLSGETSIVATILSGDPPTPFDAITGITVVSLSVNPAKLYIAAGGTGKFTASSTLAQSVFSWSSSNPVVATVDQNGNVSGLKAGISVISVNDKISGASATATLEVNKVTVSPDTVSIPVGGTKQLTASGGFSYKWTSSDSLVAGVSDAGLVTGLKPGTALITVLDTRSGASTTAEVKVIGISVNPSTAKLPVNSTQRFVASGGTSYKWSSSDPAVTVTAEGLAYFPKAGAFTITATDVSGAVGSATVTVVKLEVNPTSVSLAVNNTVKLQASGGTGYQWKSYDDKLVTVDSAGNITGKAPGSTQVLVMDTESKATAVANVSVIKVTVTPDKVTLALGKSLTLVAVGGTYYKWESNAENIAQVQEGLVTATGIGTATITVTDVASTASASAVITVSTMTPAEAYLAVGDCLVLQVVGEQPTSWQSDNTGIAEVDAAGKVCAKSAGDAIISAMSGETTIAQSTIMVRKIEVAPPQAAFPVLTSLQLTASGGTSYIWTSSNSTIAAVNANGLVSGKAAGNVNITATDNVSQLKASASLEVVKVEIKPAVAYLKQNDTLRLTASGGTAYTWKSSSSSIASVDQTGMVTANATGKANITATDDASGANYSSLVVVVQISVSPANPVVAAGSSVQFTPAGGTAYSWSSSDPTVNISGLGLTRFTQPGVVQITATDKASGATGNANVTVVKLAIEAPSLAMPVDGTMQLTAQVQPVEYSGYNLIWDTSDPAIAGVDSAGVVTGKSAGVVKINLKDSVSQATASVDLTIVKAGLEPQALSLISGDTKQMKAFALPEGHTPSWQWSSSNPVVANVDQQSGLVTANQQSQDIVVIEALDLNSGATATAQVSVLELAVNPSAIYLPKDEIFQFTVSGTAGEVTWASQNPQIVTIDSNGVAKGMGAGVTSIELSLTANPAVKDVAQVTVVELSLQPSPANVAQGGKIILQPVLQPSGAVPAPDYTWSSQDENIATVSVSGEVSGLQSGLVQIDVTEKVTGAKASVDIQVIELRIDSAAPKIWQAGRVVFQSDKSGNDDIWLMGSEGDYPVQITTHPASDVSPRLSPGGNRIAFASNRTGYWELYAITIGQPVTESLTSGKFTSLVTPVWSPKGDRIAFSASTKGSGWEDIYVINSDGSGGLTKIVATQDRDYLHVYDWSADGNQLVYQAKYNPDLWIMNSDGTGQERLTFTSTNQHPDLAADGSLIAFSYVPVRGLGTSNIYLTSLENPSLLSPLTTDGLSSKPRWGGEGYVYYQSRVSGLTELFRTTLEGSTQKLSVLEGSNKSNPDWVKGQNSLAVAAGKTVGLAVVADPATYQPDSLNWSSSNSSVATVNASGVVTTVKAGVTTIAVTDINTGAGAQITVRVIGLAISPAAISLAVGSSVPLKVSGGFTYDWTSSDTRVAMVSDSGVVMATGAGTAIITATGKVSGAVAQASVQVVSVTVTPPSGLVGAGQTYQFAASGGTSYKWTSSDTAMATVDQNGLVTGVKSGQVNITASDIKTGAKASAGLKVVSLDLTPTLATLTVGGSLEFNISGGQQYSWSSSNSSIIKVSQGLATALSAGGPVTITATDISSGATANSVLNVVSIKLNPVNAYTRAGGEVSLTATGGTAYTWSGEDETIAIASDPGNTSGTASFQGLSGGSTTVKATDISGITAEATLTVVELALPSAVTTVGQKIQLSPSVVPSAYNPDLVWSLDNQKLASLSSTGLLTARSVGVVNVTVLDLRSGASSTAPITITSLALDPTVIYLAPSGTGQFTAVISPVSYQGQADLSWSSSDSRVVEVSSDGSVSAKGMAGEAFITAKDTLSGATARASVRVIDVSIEPEDAYLEVGKEMDLKPSGGSTYSWSSGNTAIAMVNAQGRIKGMTPGQVTITATDSNTQIQATMILTVVKVSVDGPTPSQVEINNSIQLTGSAEPAGYAPSFVWSSSDKSIATVSSSGLVTGLSGGVVSIKVTDTKSGAGASWAVTVKVSLVSINITPVSASLERNQTLQFTATGKYSDGKTVILTNSVTWNSTAEGSINNNGLFKALSPGAATVTAQIQPQGQGLLTSNEAVINVNTPVLKSIDIAPLSATLEINETRQFSASGVYSDGEKKDITSQVNWTSSNAAAGVMDEATKGLFRALAAGQTEIKVSLDGVSQTSPAVVKVKEATLSYLVISPREAILERYEEKQFAATGHYSDGSQVDVTSTATWLSKDPSVIAPSLILKGVFSAVKAGNTTIWAELSGKTSNSSAITVNTPTVTGVSLSPRKPSLEINQTLKFTATVSYSDKTSIDGSALVTWNLTPANIGSIDDQGNFQALQAGTATLKASISGKQDSVVVTVKAATLTTITLVPETKSLYVNETQQMLAKGVYSDGTSEDLTGKVNWELSSPTVGSVDSKGLFKTANPGSTDIVASLGTGQDGQTIRSNKAVFTVNNPPLDRISLEPASGKVEVAKTLQFTAKGHYANGSTSDITGLVDWSSDDTEVGSINYQDTAGLFKAIKVGNVSISASLSGKTSPAAVVTVTAAQLQSITVSPEQVSLEKGAKQSFTATGHYSDGSTSALTSAVTWASKDKTAGTTVGTIDQQGVFTAQNPGDTEITASSGSITSSPATVTVRQPALQSLSLTPKLAELEKNQTQMFVVKGKYSDGHEDELNAKVTWDIKDPKVARIDSSGLLTPVSPGTTYLSAGLDTIKSNTATIKVKEPALVSLVISPSQATLFFKGKQNFTARASYSDGSALDVTNQVSWNFDDKTQTYGSISSTGLFTAKSQAGQVIITASLSGKPSNQAVVSIIEASLVSISIEPTTATLEIKETRQFTATGTYSDDSTADITTAVIWNSTDSLVGSIDAKGLLTAIKAGSTNVSAKMLLPDGSAKESLVAAAVTVNPAQLVSIKLTPDKAVIETGKDIQFSVSGNFNDGSSRNLDVSTEVNWTLNAPETVSIINGLASGLAGGEATVTATAVANAGISASAPVTVKEAVTLQSISISPSVLTIEEGGTKQQFTALGHYSDGSEADITAAAVWNSTDQQVGTIIQGGEFTALISGTTTLTATYSGVLSPQVTVNVVDTKPPAKVVSFTGTSGNQTVQLTWTPPGDADYAGVLIVRNEGAPASAGPVRGTTYALNATIGGGTIVFIGDSKVISYQDTGLTNGKKYFYSIYAFDEVPNYTPGTQVTAVPTAPDISLSAGTHDFSQVQLGQSSRWTLDIKNTGTEVLLLNSLTSSNSAFVLPANLVLPRQIIAGGSFGLEVTFTPAAEGTVNGSLDIGSNDPEQPQLTVTLEGTGGGTPDIGLSAAALDFEAVRVYSEKNLSFTISNQGTTRLSIASVSSTNADVTVSNPKFPLTLAAGGAVDVSVVFGPTNLTPMDPDADQLVVMSDDPDEPELIISLNGQGSLVTLTPYAAIFYGTAQIGGEGVKAGDQVFAYDPAGVLVGVYTVETEGQYGFMFIYGDDPYTPSVDEGANEGDALTFKILQNSTGKTYRVETNVPAVWSLDEFQEVNLYVLLQQKIPLRQGLNWISFSVNNFYYDTAQIPVTKAGNAIPTVGGVNYQRITEDLNGDGLVNIGDVLVSIDGLYKWIKGWDEDGYHVFDPTKPSFSNLHYLAPGLGYLIQMDQDATLVLTGQRVAANASLRLDKAGQYLLGFWQNRVYFDSLNNPPTIAFPDEVQIGGYVYLSNIGQVWDSLEGNFEWIKSKDANGDHMYNPSLPSFNNLDYMGPGYGYWIKTTRDGLVLTYPE